MSDKEIIKTIKRIKSHCYDGRCCNFCPMFINDNRCQIAWLMGLLADVPNKWNIEKIEEVICK